MLAAFYAVVRLVHLACYLVAAGNDVGLRRQVLLTALPVTGAVSLLIIGGLPGAPHQTGLWALALLVDYTGIWLAGTSGWRVPSPAHFAERYGLIFIVAVGESLVALGVGVNDQPVSLAVLVAAALGMVVAVSLWWLYFDVVASVAEGVLSKAQGEERSRLAQDSYTYLHFPIVISVIYIALGLKKVLEYVSDTADHHLSEALTGAPLVALYGGVAVHLLGHVAFCRRNIGTWNPHRSLVACVLLLLVPLAWQRPALVSLALVATLLASLVTYETLRFGSGRDRVRHGSTA